MSGPSSAMGSGWQDFLAPPRAMTQWNGVPKHEAQGQPGRGPVGSRRTHAASRAGAALLAIACRITLEHEVDGPRSCRDLARQAVARLMFFLQARHRLWLAGLFRRNNTVASEQAQGRDALPIGAPAVPARVPADAFVPVSREP